MKKAIYFVFLLVLVAVSFLAGSWYSQQQTVKSKASSVKSQPIDAINDPARNETASMAPGAVRISPDKQQAIGVRVGSVEKKPFTHTLRVLGRIAVDETRIYRLNAAVDGWVQEIFPVTVGSLIKKDQPLASYYSPEFLGPMQAYFYALGAMDRYVESGTEPPAQIALTRANVQQAIDSLKNLGMGDIQIEELKRSRQLTQRVMIRAPAAGFVIGRNVFPGQRFERGTEFYRIADLSHVWILADLFGREASQMRPGMSARAFLSDQGLTFSAKVSDVLPQFDPATRTLKVRLEADNPGYILKPDMFVDVELPINLPPAIAIPADAVLDSGLKKTVFVDLGNGFFEPREVETGWRFGNQVEITKGLKSGEKIVVSGNFLIDSESRLELAAARMVGTLAKDPVCGLDVSINKAEKTGRKSVYKGKTFYFSSDECKEKFEKNPENYIKQ